MRNSKSIATTAIAGLFAVGLSGIGVGAMAADKNMEKCYGVVKAGQNDCKTANGSCAGSSKVDNSPEAFLVVPKGTCDKIVGGSLKPKA